MTPVPVPVPTPTAERSENNTSTRSQSSESQTRDLPQDRDTTAPITSSISITNLNGPPQSLIDAGVIPPTNNSDRHTGIIISSTGSHRSFPAGGDYDGDKVIVIWSGNDHCQWDTPAAAIAGGDYDGDSVLLVGAGNDHCRSDTVPVAAIAATTVNGADADADANSGAHASTTAQDTTISPDVHE